MASALKRIRNGDGSGSFIVPTPPKKTKGGPASPSPSSPSSPSSSLSSYRLRLGCLLAVRLKHFMNHSQLKLELDPGVNVITGDNGSGKSSLLQAIVLALGNKEKD